MLTLHPNSHRRGACKRRKPSAVSSCQDLQQRLSLLEVDGVKALGEPAIDLRQELMRGLAQALVLPEPAQAHDRTQFKRLRPLTLGQRQGLLELLTSTPIPTVCSSFAPFASRNVLLLQSLPY
jgi:hypothetical protein